MLNPRKIYETIRLRRTGVKPAFSVIPKKPRFSLQELGTLARENRGVVLSGCAAIFGGLLLVGSSYVRDIHATHYKAPATVSAATLPDNARTNVVRQQAQDDPFVDIDSLQAEGEKNVVKAVPASPATKPAVQASHASAGAPAQRSVYFTPPIPQIPANRYAQQAPVPASAPVPAAPVAAPATPKAEPAPEKKGWQDSRIAFFGGENPTFGQLDSAQQ